MPYDPNKHHRRSVRLKGYDYAQAGAYFVTICTQDRTCLFGMVADGEMRPRVVLDAFVVMPNHLHGIITVVDISWDRGTLQRAPTTERFGQPTTDSIPTIVRLFKSATTKRINELRGMPGVPVWQRNYYEHIIRDEKSLSRISQYIIDNPVQWMVDRENPLATTPEPENAWLALMNPKM